MSKCVEFLKQIKDTCYEQILEVYQKERYKPKEEKKLITFVCDGFWNYRGAFNKLFFHVAKLCFGVSIKAKVAGLEHNNNPIERENGNIKDRIKVMRGGFTSFNGADAFLNLRRVIRNFVNPHQGLNGRTTAEAAEIYLELGRNKIKGLVERRAKIKHHSLR